MCSSMSRFPLIDVNQLTVSETWPLLISALSSAHFIAIDLELSGLGWERTKAALDSGERYKLQCDVASSYGILSMGVACFQWQQPSSSSTSALQTYCKVEAFNVWMLSQQSYTIDPSSAQFLMEHGFDFNKQFLHGLPYTPLHSNQQQHRTKLRDSAGHLPTLFGLILCTGCPLIVHNGLMDLLFLYSHLYAPLPPRLDVFMADLSEMFAGGVYDTKAIAELHLHEQASFLEYIFRRWQRHDLLAADSRPAAPHLELVFADYADLECGQSCLEYVSLLPPPLPHIQQLLQIQLCHTFTSYGYCHRRGCERSHDVLVSIALEEHKLELAKAKRKRRKEIQAQRKRRKLLNGGGESTSSTEHVDKHEHQGEQQEEQGEQQEEQEEERDNTEPAGNKTQLQELHQGDDEFAESAVQDTAVADEKGEGIQSTGREQLSELFECELTAAKEKFSQQQHQAHSKGGENVKLKPSFGHRAGFDAFMTGYSFASMAVSLCKAGGDGGPAGEGEDEHGSGMISKLREMRNKLANRGKTFPLHILKSHFTNTSQQHNTAQLNIREYFNKHPKFNSDHEK